MLEQALRDATVARMTIGSGVSMKDIAEKAGCSISTVSRALRANPRISAAVAAKVRKTAKQLGYAWSPQASDLMAGFRAKALGKSKSMETIALVHALGRSLREEEPTESWKRVKLAATEVGFHVDEFPLDPLSKSSGLSGPRLSQVLRNRGIRGLLLFPFFEPDIRHWNLDWDNFVTVACGSCPARPNIDRVDLSDFEDATTCLQEITRRGYRRIGFTSSFDLERHTRGVYTAAYQYFMSSQPELSSFPILRLARERNKQVRPGDRAEFERWYRKHKPEAILTGHHVIRDWLREMGARVPEDIGLATFIPREGWAGIDWNSFRLVKATLEYLSAKLWTNATGLSPTPKRILIQSPWIDGDTMRSTVVSKKNIPF